MTADNGRHAGARIGAGGTERRVSTARLQSTRRWLEQIVATLPEPRQRMYDLFVARGLDSRRAARELGTGVAEVRRLRRENRDAVLRAFEVTALAADAAQDEPWSEAPGCGELRQIMAAARDDARRRFVVLPAALRVIVVRHLSQCATCQARGDDCMAAWAPELLSIMGDAERHEQVMADTRSMQEPGQGGPVPGAHRRAGTARNRRPARSDRRGAADGTAAARVRVARVSPRAARSPGPVAAGFREQRPEQHGRTASDRHWWRSGGQQPRANRFSRNVRQLEQAFPHGYGSMAAQAYASPQPSVYYTLPPAPSPTPSLGQPTAWRRRLGCRRPVPVPVPVSAEVQEALTDAEPGYLNDADQPGYPNSVTDASDSVNVGLRHGVEPGSLQSGPHRFGLEPGCVCGVAIAHGDAVGVGHQLARPSLSQGVRCPGQKR